MYRVALFDFDRTLVPFDSYMRFVLFVMSRTQSGFLRLFPLSLFVILKLVGAVSSATVKAYGLRHFFSFPSATRETLLTAFVNEKLVPSCHQRAIQNIESCRSKGFFPILLSASPDIYVDKLGEALGFSLTIATSVNLEAGLVRIYRNCKREEKLARLSESIALSEIEWSSSISFSDSQADSSMLLRTGSSIVVNPRIITRIWAMLRGLSIERWS